MESSTTVHATPHHAGGHAKPVRLHFIMICVFIDMLVETFSDERCVEIDRDLKATRAGLVEAA